MTELTIYHNTRCSKSRQTLQLIENKGVNVKVIDYLKNPPNHNELSNLIHQLGFDSARQLMRKNEAEYQALNLNNTDLSEAELIDTMIAHPKLIERPIVSDQYKSIIGRPPENVLTLI